MIILVSKQQFKLFSVRIMYSKQVVINITALLAGLLSLTLACNTKEVTPCLDILFEPQLSVTPYKKEYKKGDTIIVSWVLSDKERNAINNDSIELPANLYVTSFFGIAKYYPQPKLLINALDSFLILPHKGSYQLLINGNDPQTKRMSFLPIRAGNKYIFSLFLITNAKGVFGIGSSSGNFKINERCRADFEPVFVSGEDNIYLRDSITQFLNWSSANQSGFYFIVK